MKILKIFLVIFLFFLLLGITVCKEKYFLIEEYGNRKVICIRTGNQADELIKFELNKEGNFFTAIYWQKNAALGYLIDLRAEKLFIDVSSWDFFPETPRFLRIVESRC